MAEILKFNDKCIACVRIPIHSVDEFDYLTMEFRDKTDQFYILSSDKGVISENRIIIREEKLVNTEIECDRKVNSIECVVTYHNNGYSKQDTVNVLLPETNIITPTRINATIVNKWNVSKWKLNTQVEDDDVVIYIVEKSDKALIAFGEMSREILASDIIFSIDSAIDRIIIPKEILWIKYDKCDHEMELGCSEIVKMHYMNNLYYKIPISNYLKCSDCPQKSERSIYDFNQPTGKPFTEDEWELDKVSVLPRIR